MKVGHHGIKEATMKEKYYKPEILIEEYVNVDVLTSSVVGDLDDNDVPFGD